MTPRLSRRSTSSVPDCERNLCRKKKIGQTGVRTWNSLNLVRVRYRYATQLVVGGIIDSNDLNTDPPG